MFSLMPNAGMLERNAEILTFILQVLSYIPPPFMILITFSIIIFLIRALTI